MTMPTENFHTGNRIILPLLDPGYTASTGDKYPTADNTHVNKDAGVTSWDLASLGHDDLTYDGILQFIAGVTGFKENIAGNMKSVTVLGFDWTKVPTTPGVTIDSFSVTIQVLVDSDSDNAYNVYLDNIALHMWNPPDGAPIYPSPAVGSPISINHIRSDHSQEDAQHITVANIPASVFGNPTPEEVNSNSFTLSLRFRFDGGGSSTENTKIMLYVISYNITYTVPPELPPGAADTDPNLIKMGTV